MDPITHAASVYRSISESDDRLPEDAIHHPPPATQCVGHPLVRGMLSVRAFLQIIRHRLPRPRSDPRLRQDCVREHTNRVCVEGDCVSRTDSDASGSERLPPPPDRRMGLIPFALNDFKVSITLFPKCFSSFVHTTCSLSVLAHHLAFADVHLPVCTALSNCATLRARNGDRIARRARGQTASRTTKRWHGCRRVVRPPRPHFPERFVCLRRRKIPSAVALQFHSFRFHPLRIQA